MTTDTDEAVQATENDSEIEGDEPSSHHDASGSDQEQESETGDRCRFVFDPSAWNEEHDRTSPLSELWRCPHAAVAHPGFDRCPFHLSGAERDEVGLSDADLRRRFRKAVEGSGQRTKEFIGATLDTLAVRQQRLRGPDAHPINFAHAEFKERLDFRGSTVGQPLFLAGASIKAFAAAEAQFEAPVYFLNAHVGTLELEGTAVKTLDLRGVCIDGRTNCRGVHVDDDLRCVGAIFRDFVHAEGCTCDGMVDIGNATLEKNLDLDGSEVEALRLTDTDGTRFDLRELRIHGRFEAEGLSAEIVDIGSADIGGTASLKRSRIERTVELRGLTAARLDLSGATVGANLHLNRAVVDGDVLVRDLTVMGVFAASHGVFKRARFTGSTFRGPCRFDDAAFTAGASFGNAVFEDHIKFTDATFEDEARFLGVTVHADASFERCRFQNEVTLEPAHGSTPLRISFEGASIDRGRIHCRDGISYDLTDATLGNVYFDAAEVSKSCFEYLKVANTTFDGFDFGRYKRQLKRSNWRLHTTSAVDFDETTAGLPSETNTGRQDDSEMDLGTDVLENTYLKAKNGAKAVGDNKAAAEFFRREMKYRRYQHFAQATRESNTRKEQLVGVARWSANYLLNVTSGYGERPSRVILISVGIIFMFAASYGLIAQSTFQAGSFGEGYLLFSFQSYVTFIPGDPVGPEAGFWLRLLSAVEGFIGAFLVALFVFTLTRSVHR